MVYLKAIQSSLTPITHVFPGRKEKLRRRAAFLVSFCKSNDSDPSSQPPKEQPQGDSRRQELLARIAMIQAEKVRLTDYLDERSSYLTKFAEQANAEIDQIGAEALRQLDEAGTRILGDIETHMQAIEESSAVNKMEIEKREKMVEDFEGQMERERNEGLFFKSLIRKKPIDKAKAKEEVDKIKELTKEKAGLKIRRNIYLALIALVATVIGDALIYSSAAPQKVAVLGLILVGLCSQLIYEQKILSETEKRLQQQSDENKK